MKLSVCIFTYNHEKFIAIALESVLIQETNFQFEIIIGEDCSADNTKKILKDFEKRCPDKIKVFYNSRNLGIMHNNANTINRCKGEYIALLDGDDYWTYPKKLQRQVDFLENNAKFNFCFHDGKILKTDLTFDSHNCCGPKQKKIVSFSDIICDTHIPTFSIVFRRNKLHGYPPAWFDSLHAPDRPLFLLLSSNGPGYYFNECWAVYRKHIDGCWTRQNFQTQLLTHMHIYKILNMHFKEVYKKPFCKCEIRAIWHLTIGLIKEKKVQRARCYFRKYLKYNRGFSFFYPRTLYNCLLFWFFYFRSILHKS